MMLRGIRPFALFFAAALSKRGLFFSGRKPRTNELYTTNFDNEEEAAQGAKEILEMQESGNEKRLDLSNLSESELALKGHEFFSNKVHGWAIKCWERQLKLLCQRYEQNGSAHPSMLSPLLLVAGAYAAEGDHQTQILYLARAAKIALQVFGCEHPQRAATLVKLAEAKKEIGDHSGMLQDLEEALSILEKKYGTHHFKLARTLALMSEALGEAGKYEAQLDVAKRACELEVERNGDQSLEICSSLLVMAKAFGNLGKFEEQSAALAKVVAIQEAQVGVKGAPLIKTLHEIGKVEAQLGRFNQRIKTLERAISILLSSAEVTATFAPLGLQCYFDLASSYGALGDLQKQLAVAKEAVGFAKEKMGVSHAEYGVSLLNLSLATLAVIQRNGEGAALLRQVREHLQYALGLLEPALGKQHPHVAKIKSLLARR